MSPISYILLSKPLKDYQLVELDQYLNCIGEIDKSSSQFMWRFWVSTDKIVTRPKEEQGCHFSVHINGIEEYDDKELIQIHKFIDYFPASAIHIDAGCNQKVDHLLLA